MDLVLQSLILKVSPSEIYSRYYKVGWSSESEGSWLGFFTMELQKPCGFLKGQGCGIYPVRPICCALFPEAWFLQHGEDPPIMKKGRFHDYPCLKDPSPISDKRKRRLAALSEMSAQERWLSDFYLFGFTPFCVDLKNLMEELLEIAKHQGLSIGKIDPDVQHVIPYALIEELFQSKLRQSGIIVRILEKATSLDSPGKRASFFELKKLTDEMQRSLGSDDISIY